MKTKDSTEARPWFIPPTWAAVAPLVIFSLRSENTEAAKAAEAEIIAGFREIDRLQERARLALGSLHAACAASDIIEARAQAARARALLEGAE